VSISTGRSPRLGPDSTATSELKLDRIASAQRTALTLPANLSLEKWKYVGRQISLISDSSAWWIGDWLLFGRVKYPDRYKRALQETSLDYQTLRNYAWVATRFGVSRRRDRLSFHHHMEVAALPENQQDLWLGRAEENGWSRNELRSKLRASRRHRAAAGGATVTVQLIIAEERRQSWQLAARRSGTDLLEWMTEVLDEAARTREPDDHSAGRLPEQHVAREGTSAG
jgi:hypothetical protein